MAYRHPISIMATADHLRAATDGPAHARGTRWRVRMVAVLMLLCAASASAQPAERDQREAAAAAYDRGTAAYLRDDYTRAARWFETAHRLAPAAPALIQAARAHAKADDLARALTLALRLQTEYANDDRAVALADELLSSHAGAFVRVSVQCQGCRVDLDGKLQESKEFFVEPDADHDVTAIFDTGKLTEQINGSSSETLELSFEAPPAPVGDRDSGVGTQPGPDLTPAPAGGGKLPPLAVYIGAGITGALLTGMIVSGIDANAKGDRYERGIDDFDTAGCREMPPDDPDQCRDLRASVNDRFDDADSAETRTNVLLALTLVAAAGTGVVAAFFTDWHQDQPSNAAAPLRIGLASMGDGAYGTVGGAF